MEFMVDCSEEEVGSWKEKMVKGRKVRQWDLAGCESAVADDQGGQLYLAEELRGIWEVGAEPDRKHVEGI